MAGMEGVLCRYEKFKTEMIVELANGIEVVAIITKEAA